MGFATDLIGVAVSVPPLLQAEFCGARHGTENPGDSTVLNVFTQCLLSGSQCSKWAEHSKHFPGLRPGLDSQNSKVANIWHAFSSRA